MERTQKSERNKSSKETLPGRKRKQFQNKIMKTPPVRLGRMTSKKGISGMRRILSAHKIEIPKQKALTHR